MSQFEIVCENCSGRITLTEYVARVAPHILCPSCHLVIPNPNVADQQFELQDVATFEDEDIPPIPAQKSCRRCKAIVPAMSANCTRCGQDLRGEIVVLSASAEAALTEAVIITYEHPKNEMEYAQIEQMFNRMPFILIRNWVDAEAIHFIARLKKRRVEAKFQYGDKGLQALIDAEEKTDWKRIAKFGALGAAALIFLAGLGNFVYHRLNPPEEEEFVEIEPVAEIPLVAEKIDVEPPQFFKFETQTTPGGMELWLHPRLAANEAQIRVVVRAGRETDIAGEEGAAFVMAQLLKLAADNVPGEMAEAREAAGAFDFRADVGSRATVFSLTSPRARIVREVEYLMPILLEGRYDESELPRAIAAGNLSQYMVKDRFALRDFISGFLFPGTKAAEVASATMEQRKALGIPMLRSFHRRMYNPANITFIAVGDVDPGVLSKYLSDITKPADGAEKAVVELPPTLPWVTPLETRAGAPVELAVQGYRGGLPYQPEFFITLLAAEYLERCIRKHIQAIRAESGGKLETGPMTAGVVARPELSLLYVQTGANPGEAAEFSEPVDIWFEKLRGRPFANSFVQLLRLNLLRRWANLHFEYGKLADFYAQAAVDVYGGRPFPEFSAEVAKATPQSLHEFATKFVVPENSFRLILTPSLSEKK